MYPRSRPSVMSASTFSCCLPKSIFLPGVRLPIWRLADARGVFFFFLRARTARFAAGRPFIFVARLVFCTTRRALRDTERLRDVFFFFCFFFAIQRLTHKKMTREDLLPSWKAVSAY